MSVSPSDFLTSAEHAAEQQTEIGYRNAISRAYYAVFHEALGVAEAHFSDPNAHLQMGEHERLSERYKRWDNLPQSRSISIMLVNMKSQRHIADYALTEEVTCTAARTQLQLAEKLIERLNASVTALNTASHAHS